MPTRTFEPTEATYQRIRDHIREYELTDQQKAYPRTKKRIQDVRDLYLIWMDLCDEYRIAFQKIKIKRASRHTNLLLSSLGTGVENSFFEVSKARIPTEVYFIVQDFYKTFGYENRFVIASGEGFELDTVSGEVEKELKGSERPLNLGANAGKLRKLIEKKDYTKIYYENITYDSPLTWPLLLHEVFHDVHEREGVSRALNLPSNPEWIREVVVDLYAAIFFGPAYALSLALYHERYPGGGGISHPPEAARLAGLLSLLEDLTKKKNGFARPVQNVIQKAHRFVNEIWTPYRHEKPEIQKQVREFYQKHRQAAIDFHHRKRQDTFEELITKSRANVGRDFERIQTYTRLGIPVAVEPRILFNGLVVTDSDPEFEYVAESIKKWFLSNVWNSIPPKGTVQ